VLFVDSAILLLVLGKNADGNHGENRDQ